MIISRQSYTVWQKGSASIMILMLLWLTISAPFVFACQQQLLKDDTGKQSGKAVFSGTDSEEESTTNPYGNNNEEKGPGNNGIAEEYLHETADTHLLPVLTGNYLTHHDARDYTAFHGELLVPPPNFSC